MISPSLSVESLIMIFFVSGEVALSSLSIDFSILSSWVEEFSFSIAIWSTYKQVKINSYVKYLCYVQNKCSMKTYKSTNISDFIFQRLINPYYFNSNTLYRFLNILDRYIYLFITQLILCRFFRAKSLCNTISSLLFQS